MSSVGIFTRTLSVILLCVQYTSKMYYSKSIHMYLKQNYEDEVVKGRVGVSGNNAAL